MSPTEPIENPYTGPNTEIGRAVQQLRKTLKLLARSPSQNRTPAQLAEVYTHVRWALDNLCSVDRADVDRWLDEEHCALCGQPSVALLDDHGAPYCARCWPREVARQQQLDDDVVQYRSAQFTETDREGGA